MASSVLAVVVVVVVAAAAAAAAVVVAAFVTRALSAGSCRACVRACLLVLFLWGKGRVRADPRWLIVSFGAPVERSRCCMSVGCGRGGLGVSLSLLWTRGGDGWTSEGKKGGREERREIKK